MNSHRVILLVLKLLLLSSLPGYLIWTRGNFFPSYLMSVSGGTFSVLGVIVVAILIEKYKVKYLWDSKPNINPALKIFAFSLHFIIYYSCFVYLPGYGVTSIFGKNKASLSKIRYVGETGHRYTDCSHTIYVDSPINPSKEIRVCLTMNKENYALIKELAKNRLNRSKYYLVVFKTSPLGDIYLSTILEKED